jgi:hypothetical protein
VGAKYVVGVKLVVGAKYVVVGLVMYVLVVG